MVAAQAGLALSQARAYERISALAKREALINTITKPFALASIPKTSCRHYPTVGASFTLDGCALSLWTESDEFSGQCELV